MRTLLKISFAALVCAVSSLSAQAQGVVVYQNYNNYIAPFSGGSGTEYGDQVILSGTERQVTAFSFEYWGQGFANGAASADIKFYKNDGALVNGTAGPGSLIFDSGSFTIDPTTGGGKILNFDAAALNGGFVVPDSFTWTVTFNVPTGGDAGLSIYTPPTVGNSYVDYYVNNGGTWQLRSGLNGQAVDFGASLTASPVVPEPATIALLGLGGVAALMLRRRK